MVFRSRRTAKRISLASVTSRRGSPNVIKLTNAELVQLQTRVIALENLLIALLAQATDLQLDFARSMAAYIAPRPGFTAHPLTIHAAAQMIHLVERGSRFGACHLESLEPL